MIEKWRQSLDNGGHAGALLTDLSKAFDCIDHDLLIAKLNAYGLDSNSLNFINSYLKNRKQRTRINSSYSDFSEITDGVPQGSILGPLLFNIYICGLFFDTEDLDIASFADDNTPYTCSPELQSVLDKLQEGTVRIFKWFIANRLKSNADKCHLLASTDSSVNINVSNITIKNENRVKLLGVHIDRDLNFDFHVEKLCKAASKKLHALTRICRYMETNKRRMLMKAFIISQFTYCPLIWMFHSKAMEHRINKIHERALRLVYDNSHDLSFEELLIKDKSVSIHQRNLQALAIEISKAQKGLSPSSMSEIFHFVKKPYNL